MPEPTAIDADHPLILLPVRLETRFFGSELWIRVYPDAVHVDTHEPELTHDELRWGRHFHEELWRAADDESRRTAAWQQLAERFGAGRAGWVGAQLTPLDDDAKPRTPLPAGAPLAPPPRFPDVAARPLDQANETWTRAPWSRLLPDRWFGAAFSNGAPIASVLGNAIPDPLPVGPDPTLSITEDPAGSPLDDGNRWMVDFAEAERIGMALRLPLPPLPAGSPRVVDRLIVVGVKPSLDAATGASRLAELLRAHQYTDGLAFLAQGTPTNNGGASTSGFASEDPGHERSARWFLAVPRARSGDGSDGDELARALGVPVETVGRATGAERRSELDARRLHEALWPATWGYYLDQLLHGVFAEADHDASSRWARQHFVEHVRAGGPLPALRIGRQPYGILPVTSLAGWAAAGGEQVEPTRDGGVVGFLRRQRGRWLAASVTAPRMGRNPDPATDFAEVFGMDALSSRYAQRNAMGEKYAWHLLGSLGMFPLTGRSNETFQQWSAQHLNQARIALGQAGLPERALAARLSKALHFDLGRLVQVTRMDAEGAPELVASQLERLATAPSLDAVVRHEGIPTPHTTIYLLLRHALLVEYASAAARALGMPPAQRVEEDQLGFAQLGTFETLLARIARAGLHAGAAFTDPGDAQLRAFRQALAHLRSVPARELDVLVRGLLDLSSHRLDAWITSFATKRLRHMRRTRPAGAYVGGYGWLEDLRPARADGPPPPPPTPDAPAVLDASNPGFVHAPSLEQAATVAVLRSGHLTHAATGKEDLLAVDLSSERARLARWLLDGVRAGQPLGALLGYRFERGLHEHHPALLLDRFIRPLRELAPITATRVDASGEAVESVPATHVVDGLKLVRRWNAQPTILTDALRVTPPMQPAELAALQRELGLLAQAVDAVSDALLAESVHQLVRGNPARAAATLDAVERGEAPPPELEVLRTPRSGLGLTHRVVVTCPGSAAAPSWQRGADSPRALAEPALDAWVARLLGDPSRVRLRIERREPGTAMPIPVSELRLSDLRLAPLDVLYASPSGDELAQSDVEQLALDRARRAMPELPADAVLRVNPARDPSWPMTELSWSEFAQLVGAARRLVGASRPLQPGDLAHGELADADGTDVVDVADLQARAEAAVAGLRAAAAALRDALASAGEGPLEPLRDAVLALSYYGVAGAVPLPVRGDGEGGRQALVLQARSIAQEAESRLANVAESDAALADASTTVEGRIGIHQQRLRHVFGHGFVVLPRFRAPHAEQLTRSLADSAAIQGGDPFAVVTFHQRMARVRGSIAHLDDLLRYAEALGGDDGLQPDVLQLPYRERDRWIGLAATAEHPLAGGRISIIAHGTTAVDFTRPVAGLMVDEWVEVVPNADETTGLVFQSNQPDSCPPHAILVAVPPDPTTTPGWSEPALAQMLHETLDLVRVRAVPPDLLQELSQYLPALYFPLNAADETISVDLGA